MIYGSVLLLKNKSLDQNQNGLKLVQRYGFERNAQYSINFKSFNYLDKPEIKNEKGTIIQKAVAQDTIQRIGCVAKDVQLIAGLEKLYGRNR